MAVVSLKNKVKSRNMLAGNIQLPSVISGLKLWLDGKESGTFTFSSGTSVSEWRDRSGQGNNFSQATAANQPTRGSDRLVDFDGSNDQLDAATKFMNNVHNGGSNTIFAILRLDADQDGSYLDSNNLGSNGVGFNLAYEAANDRYLTGINNGNSGQNVVVNTTATSSVAINTTYCLIQRIDADNATAANRHYFYINRGSAIQNNTSSNAVSAANSTLNPRMGNGGLGYWNGKIGEILWYDRDLTDSEREIVRDYLLVKWNI